MQAVVSDVALPNAGTPAALPDLVFTLRALGPQPVPATHSLGLNGLGGEVWRLLRPAQAPARADKHAAQAAVEALLAVLARHQPYLFDLSLASGRAGIAWLLAEAHDVLGQPSYLRAAEALLREAPHDYLLNSPNSNEFYQGKPGIIYVLLRLYRQTFSAALAALLDRYVLALLAELNLAAAGGVAFKGLRTELPECARLLHEVYLLSGNPTYAYLARQLGPDESAPLAPPGPAGLPLVPAHHFWPDRPAWQVALQRKLLRPIYRLTLRPQLFTRFALPDVFDVLLMKAFHRTLFVVRLVEPALLTTLQAHVQQALADNVTPAQLVQHFTEQVAALLHHHQAPDTAVLAEIFRLEKLKYSALLALEPLPAAAAAGQHGWRYRAFELLNAEPAAFAGARLQWRFPLTLLQLSRNYFFNPALPDAALDFNKAIQQPPTPFTYLLYPDRDNGQIAEHVLQPVDEFLLRLFEAPCTVADALAQVRTICQEPEAMIRYGIQKGILSTV